MKIPLMQSSENQFAVGADTSKTISIGFETTELDRGDMPKPQGGPVECQVEMREEWR